MDVTTIVTALSLLAHMLLGCCWHHEHPCVAPSAEVAAIGTTAEAGHACECSHHHGAEEPAAPEHHQSPCDENRCLTEFRDSGPNLGLDEALPTMVGELVGEYDRDAPSLAPDLLVWDVDPPLRTHLLLQILLI